MRSSIIEIKFYPIRDCSVLVMQIVTTKKIIKTTVSLEMPKIVVKYIYF